MLHDLTKDGGVVKEIIKEGTGSETPKNGSDVIVHYCGTLSDGTKFDSSRDRYEPFKFKLGAGQVILGWDKVVPTMKKGEISKVTLQPDYGFGVRGNSPNVPPNAVLNFEIELINFDNERDISGDGGILKKILKDGEDWQRPGYETICQIYTKLTDQQDTVYEESTKTVTIGDEDITKGLEKALESMKRSERALFKVKSNYAYGDKGNPSLNILPNTNLIYEIELIDFKKEKESWEIEKFSEKEEASLKRKNEGNNLFSQNKFELAIRKYKKALDLFNYESSLSEIEKETVKKEIKLPCYLNIAACHLKLKEYKETLENTDKALQIDPNSVKSLWRRGSALTELGQWEEAQQAFMKALEIDPKNTAGLKEMIEENKMDLQPTITITETEKIKDGRTLYVIEVSVADKRWTVRRTYEEFVAVYNFLKNRVPSANFTTQLKNPGWFSSSDPEYYRNLGQHFLDDVLKSVEALNTWELSFFLDGLRGKTALVQKGVASNGKILFPLPDNDFDPSESAIPWKCYSNEGFEVVFATENGEKANCDPTLIDSTGIIALLKMDAAPEAKSFYHEMYASFSFSNPISYEAIIPSDYSAFHLAGGHAPRMKQYLECKTLQDKIVEFWHLKRPIAAICHGVLLLSRCIDPDTNKSVLWGTKTTTLPKWMEVLAYNATRISLGKWYRTYDEYCENEVCSFLENAEKQFEVGPSGFSKGTIYNDTDGFVVEEDNYVSARWPGDAFLLAKKLLNRLI